MFSGIKKRLTLSLILTSIVPLLISTVILLYSEYTVQKKQTFLLQKEESIRISEQINEYFRGLEKDIDFLLSITSFVAEDIRIKKNLLSRMISKENQFDRLSLTDKYGMEIFYIDRTLPFVENKEFKYTNQKLTNKVIQHEKNYYGQIYFENKSFEPLIDAAFLIKNLKTSDIENVIVAKIRFKKIWELLASVIHLEGEEVFVTNSKNMIVAHKNPSLVIKKTVANNPLENGFVKDRTNTYVLRSTNSFNLNGVMFNVVVQRNIYDALSLSFNTLIFASVLMVVLLSFIFIVMKYIDKSIINPILDLSNIAKEISKGDLKQKAKVYGNDELSFLAITFNDMSRKINKTMDTLKEEIELKTAVQYNLETSEKRLLAIMNNTNAAIYLKDLESKYVIVNEEFLKIHKVKKEGIINKPTSVLFEGEQLAYILDQELQIKLTKENITTEEQLYLNDSEERFFLSNRFPIFDKDGNMINIVGVSTDITHIKNIQKQLENFNKDLEKKIADKTKDLTTANEELEDMVNKLHQTQEQLIFSEKIASLGLLVSGVAHEINTPLGVALTGITYFDDITTQINESYSSNNMSQEEFENYLEASSNISKQILLNLKRTSNLIQTFKQVSVNQIDEEKREIDVKAYTNTLISTIPNQTKTIIQNNIPNNIKLNTYPGAYGQVITILILNSLSHAYDADEKGTIIISLEQEPNQLKLKFSDDGRGIEKNDLPHIFEPFFTTKRNLGGPGLGLNILYNIVRQQLKGKVSCTSKLNQGVSFEIVIPIV